MRLRQSPLTSVVVALAPVVAEWIYKFAVRPRPFWVHYYDPETIHFYAGLAILAGHPPPNVDNPGTPLQLASAAIALVTGRSPLTYERFVFVAHVAGLALTSAGAVLLARTLLRGAPSPLAIAAVWTWFMAPQALEYQMVWSPEIFFFGLGTASLAAIAASLNGPPSASRDALAGASVGVLIATKFVFLPWLAALAVAYFAARERPFPRAAIATLSALGGFVAATLVAIPRYPAMLAWLVRLAAHSGAYGGGPRGAPRIGDVLAGYLHLASISKAWIAWLAIIAACAVVTFTRSARGLRPVVIFGGVASALSIVMTMRMPEFRYLLPVALCALLFLATAADEVRKVRWLPAALCLVAAVLLAKAIAGDVRNHRKRIDEQVALHDDVVAKLRDIAPSGVVVYGWRFPAPSFALRINATNEQQLAEIALRYPREGHYEDWRHRLVLPPRAARWGALVIDDGLLPGFPWPVGRTAARAAQFRIVLPPGR